MQIIKVKYNQIKQLSEFAKDVFIDYYHDLIGLDQSLYMADKFLSYNAIKNLMDNNAIFNMIKIDDDIVAFNEYLKDDNRIFLSKLYVHKDYRHQGLGKIMLEECIRYGKENNCECIYLTVNKNNTDSINTYKHLGFKVIDAVVNDIGNNYVMDDYIMQLDI